jgi:hypothetical protein
MHTKKIKLLILYILLMMIMLWLSTGAAFAAIEWSG